MLSDALLELRQQIETGIRTVRKYQAEYPELYDEHRPQIDAALVAVEATVPRLETLRAFFDTPPDTPDR